IEESVQVTAPFRTLRDPRCQIGGLQTRPVKTVPAGARLLRFPPVSGISRIAVGPRCPAGTGRAAPFPLRRRVGKGVAVFDRLAGGSAAVRQQALRSAGTEPARRPDGLHRGARHAVIGATLFSLVVGLITRSRRSADSPSLSWRAQP